ncbi:alpha/beta hydrolase domain-containing protein [Piscinibacter koreensis]|uniref:Alpha/beta hydrolase domain-containing protein n=1 Tax=Piscinibacter koreensis TaxID=2742824 RepID=A0A7Y6NLH3_9BURK|nr:alpha/beta hydrolase domain-containing protein [Schlegelella koreensis]NUZ05398.1 hypothetical protein [Schlegelella koreensis]
MNGLPSWRGPAWLIALACSLVTACGGGGDDDDRSDYVPRLTATSSVADATVTGPIPVTVTPGDPSHNYPQLATQFDLASKGYVEEEYFFEGTANTYQTPSLATGSVATSGHRYKSRMIVRRPTEASRFNGWVIVEWVNVTSGYNLDALWQSSAAFFMREGYAYVGISAQRVGVHQAGTGLVSWSPVRYGSLDVTAGGTIVNDALSYDVFAQGAKAVGRPTGVDPLGNLPRSGRMLIASGVSQSEGRLVTYYNSIEPLHQLFDGYYLFLGLGGTLRTDVDVKVMKINTENDVLLLREALARQDDSDRLRTWEVAGASHVSFQSGAVRTPMLIRDSLPQASTACALPALSHVPVGHVLMPAYDHLARWIEDGTPPPVAPRIQIASFGNATTPSTAVRDARGNALGGIRLAEIAVPTATNTGVNSGSGFCTLFGSHQPFDPATLATLYPTNAAYVAAVRQAVEANVAAGVLLRPEADETVAAAQSSTIGR